MILKPVLTSCLVMALCVPRSLAAERPRGVVECADLHWSAQVLAANPDIARACQGVYEKNGVLYAKASIEVVSVQGNRLRFRTLLDDGTLGKRRSVMLRPGWTVKVAGRYYRAEDLTEGLRLDIFLPEDRFALTVLGSNDDKDLAIEGPAD